MSSSLRLDWCSHEAAKYAVEHWHYSHVMPAGKSMKVGVWEDGRFIGVVIFSLGANNTLGRPYGLGQTQCCELTRVALTNHTSAVTRIVAIALRMLRQGAPGLRLVVSFADPEQNHKGGIYQAGNWIYVGMSHAADEYIVHGKRMHGRSMRAKYGTHIGKPWIVKMLGSSKHRYLMPLDDEMRKRIAPLAKPYPRASRLESEAPGVQPGDEGAAMRPTRSNPWGITDG
jgi:hypothetical protein